MSKPRVALVLFPLSEIGGVATRTWNMLKGLKAAGAECDLIRLMRGPMRQEVVIEAPEPIIGTVSPQGALKLCHLAMSYSSKNVARTVQLLSTYDVVVFVHAAPHESTEKGDTTWQRLYADVSAVKVAYLTDVYWKDYYPGIADCAGSVDFLYAVNPAVANYVRATGLVKSIQLFTQPVEVTNPDTWKTDRAKRLVWANQWRSWKGLGSMVFPALPVLQKKGWEADLYGAGREYFELSKGPLWSAVGYDKGKGDPCASVRVHGTVPPDQLRAAYANALVACDFTGASSKYFGHRNRTTIEPMGFGCVVVCRTTLAAPYSDIPVSAVLTVNTSDELPLALDILANDKAMQRRLRESAYSFVWKHSADHVMKDALAQWLDAVR